MKNNIDTIKECIKKNNLYLDLSNSEIKEIPKLLFKCVWLEEIYLDNNNIEFIGDQIGGLKNLKKISLSNNRLVDISFVRKLKKIEYLDVSHNRITNVKGFLGNRHLSYLNISNNQIEDIIFLEFLSGISILNISYNFIKNINPLISLKELIFLDVSRNNINNLDIIKKLLSIEYLFFDLNQISNIDFASSLNELKEISFAYNSIKNLKPLMELFKLRIIIAENNEIENFEFLNKLTQLKKLDLRYNKISYITKLSLNFELNITWKRNSLSNEINLYRNPIKIIPTEIIKGGRLSLASYFVTIEKEREVNINHAKVILVGNGGVGKTSIVKQIFEERFNLGESQTKGIIIRNKEYVFEKEPLNVNFWDFGGQEIMHNTHQFFLTKRSLYILVIDSRNEFSNEYWFKHIESFGEDSPIIVVLNKIDENPSFDVNRHYLKNKYKGIQGFVKISCKNGKGINKLNIEVQKQLEILEAKKNLIPENWYEIMQTLYRMDHNYISYKNYYRICEKNKVFDSDSQKALLTYLHDLGVILAFPSLELHDTQVINPKWLTNAVYKVINSTKIKNNKGILKIGELDSIINSVEGENSYYKYPTNKFLYIIKIMREFELCYRLNDEEFLFPDLLGINEVPIESFDYKNSLKFIFQYDFLPRMIISRTMIQLHRRIVHGKQWATGFLIADHILKSEAVIKSDEDEKKICIWVTGENKEKQRDFFSFIREVIIDINDSFEKLKIEELIPLPNSKLTVSYKNLIGHERRGKEIYFNGELEKEYLVDVLLNGIESNGYRWKKKKATTKIAVIYSDNDEEFKDQLLDVLSPLVKKKCIKIWDKKCILPGSPVTVEMKNGLMNSQIILCLLSVDFINSSIYNSDLFQSILLEKSSEKKIIPILIKTCMINEIEIGKLKCIPEKPINKYSLRDLGWGEVYNSIKDLILKR